MPSFADTVRINQRDLALAIRTGCGPMQTFFDPRHENLPFFGNQMVGDGWGNSHHPSFSMAHIPGRWLNALLNAEDALGIPIAGQTIQHLRDWTNRSLESPGIAFPVMLDMDAMKPARATDLHNLREAMHALYALCKYRADDRAHRLALRLIQTVDAYFDDATGQLDEERYTRDTGCAFSHWSGTRRHVSPFPVTLGRYIGPLVKFYLATGEHAALAQALRLKEACFTHVLNADGDYDVEVFGGHTHSTTAMISSLALLGTVVRDEGILGRVRRFMENGLAHIALDHGWCIEGYGRTDLVGEINNTSDIMEACLLLAQHGYPGYYARAERILRGHFLPAQLLDSSFIAEDPDPSHIETYGLASRSLGAFGFPCPYGHEYQPGSDISFNWDIVGGGVGGLCEAYRARGHWDGRMYSVALLFGIDDDYVRTADPYENQGVLTLTAKRAASFRLRIPTGSAMERLHAEGARGWADGEWLYLEKLEPGQTVRIDLALQKRRETQTFRERRWDAEWFGEELAAMQAPGKRLRYFPALA